MPGHLRGFIFNWYNLLKLRLGFAELCMRYYITQSINTELQLSIPNDSKSTFRWTHHYRYLAVTYNHYKKLFKAVGRLWHSEVRVCVRMRWVRCEAEDQSVLSKHADIPQLRGLERSMINMICTWQDTKQENVVNISYVTCYYFDMRGMCISTNCGVTQSPKLSWLSRLSTVNTTAIITTIIIPFKSRQEYFFCFWNKTMNENSQ